MHVFLLRHAEAGDLSPDAERPLTEKGQKDAHDLGRLIARQQVGLPDTLWCSPYRRARETAEALLKGSGMDREIQVREGLTPYDDPADLIGELAENEEDLLLVGHNPHLAVLAGYLLGGLSGDVRIRFRKSTLMRFERIKRYSNEREPAWVLDWMLTPKLYREN